jgi:hypothetical protein
VNWARVMTNLIVQLSARVGKSRATPICHFLFHLYERHELLQEDGEGGSKPGDGDGGVQYP